MNKESSQRPNLNTEGIIEVLQHLDKFESRFKPDNYCSEYDCYRRSLGKLINKQNSYQDPRLSG